MLRRFVVFPVALLFFALVIGASADEASDRRAAFHTATELLRDRQWREAAQALSRFRQGHPGSDEAVEAWVLESRAWLESGDARKALDTTSDFLAKHGEAAWAGRVRHTAAKAYEKLGRVDEAATVLRDRVEATTSEAARAAIGKLHLELADKDFEGEETTDDLGRTTTTKNVQRAYQGYQRALQVGLTKALEIHARERMADIAEELGRHAAAIAGWNALLKEAGYDDRAKWAKIPRADEKRLERYIVGRGRTYLKGGNRAEARADLTAALKRFPRGARHMEILRLLAGERIATGRQTGDDVAYEEGIAWLRRAILEHKDDPKAVEAQEGLALVYEMRGQLEQAAAEWLALVQRFPTDERVPAARTRAAQALRNAGRFDRAVKEWERFLSAHPNHELWESVRASIVEAAYAKATDLKQREETTAAIDAYRAFAERYPDDQRAPVALVAAGTLLREEKSLDAAIAMWRGVVGRYARTPLAPMALGLIAVTLEDELGQLENAIEAYEELIKKHPRTPQAQEARARLERLRSKHLEMRAERVIGTSQAKALKVITRNIEQLDVRVYRLGLEEYFRRKGTVDGVQNLQLEIVKPDWTLEWKLEGYQPFERIEADRLVPVTEPGAYVVVAGDDDLTCTSLFLVSDIECVVKKSERRQLLVWAFDRETHAPVVGARIVAAGKGELGKTGADGVWKGRKGADTGHVLVVSDRGAATTALTQGTVATQDGFSNKAYVYTDRPVYRPSHKVYWRAIYLDGGGTYRGGAKRKGRVRVFDPRGQEVLRESDLDSSDHGVFAGSFDIDGAAPLGTWRIQVDVSKRGSWNGTFEVQEFKKPEFTIAVKPDEPVYRTGRTVSATVTLQYAFGGPVSGAPVAVEVYRTDRSFEPSGIEDYSWYFQDDRAAEADRRVSTQNSVLVKRLGLTTDADGTCAVSFETRVQDTDAEYVVVASAQDVTRRWIQDQGRIPVTRADHMAVVKTDRKVYRPKQRMKIEVRTVDPRGTPVERSGHVVLYRLRRMAVPTDVKRRGPGFRPPAPLRDEEVEEARFPVRTDASGRAELELEMPGPGRWRVRWKKTDAQGVLVTAKVDVDAAGEAEDLSKDARLIASRTLYREGQDAELLVHSPITGGKALLTYEGEEVLDYRIIDLEGTSTLVALPVRAHHAPNVFFKIAIPGPEKLLEADTEIVVLRHLDVHVAMGTSVARPGEDVEITIETRDANGAPVSAEVGVGLVDETVYAIARDTTAAIRPYFYDRRRTNAVVTASSIGARYYGTTRETSKDLLADAAARHGGARTVMAQDAIRLAREAIRRGDMNGAVAQAVRALDADPASWDARALVEELGRHSEARAYLKRAGKKSEADEGLALFGGESEEEVFDQLEKLEKSMERMDPSSGVPSASKAPTTPSDRARRMDNKPGNAASEPSADGRGFRNASRPSGGADGSEMDDKDMADSPAEAGPMSRERQSERKSSMKAADSLASVLDKEVAIQLRGSLAADGKGWSYMIAQTGAQFGLDFGGMFQVRQTFADTAAWEPHVVTDAAGKATLKVTLPDNLTTWRCTVRGVSKSALVGEARASLVARKNLLVRVDTPRFLTQGDSVTIPTVVHNNTGQGADVAVEVDVEGVRIGGTNQTLQIGIGGRGVSDRKLDAELPGPVKIQARAMSDAGADAVEVSFATLPRGLKIAEGRSGVIDAARGDVQQTFLDVPDGVIAGTSRLTIVLYPGLEEALLDRLLFLELFPYGCVEQTVHRFEPAIVAREALRASGSPAAAYLERLDEAIRRGADRIRNLQNDDGSFGWFKGGPGRLEMTAYALIGLVGGRENGVPGLNTSIDRALAALPRLLKQGDEDARALAHFALATAGRVDAETYASTFRRRSDDLSIQGLAWLAIAAEKMGRRFDVEQLTRLILERRKEVDGQTHWQARRGDCFVGSDREATALAVRALIVTKTATPHVERGLTWLVAKPSTRGQTTKEAAAFVAAAAEYVKQGRMFGFGGTIEVLLDGQVVRTVETGARPLEHADRRFEIEEADAMRAGRHTLGFRLAGQGQLGWAARLESFVASDDLPGAEHGLRVERLYLKPTEAPVEGQPAREKPGYSVLRPSARPKVEPKDLEQVVVGDRVLVRLALETERELEYVLVEDALPAGFEVLADTTRGTFDWQERRDDRQVFFLSRLPKGKTTLEFVMQATHLGAFTALGTTSHAMYAPEQHGRAAGRRIEIAMALPGGPEDPEAGPTPDERFARAKQLFAEKHYAEALPLLATLIENEPVRDAVIEEIEGLRLQIAIETDSPQEIVRAREELVRRNPARIPGDLDTQRKIAFAYHTIGEHEVANSLYRDLVARGFGLEMEWTSTLTARERELEGLDRLGLVLRSFPITNATAQAAYQRADRYRELRRPKGREGGREGAPMDAETLEALWQMTAHFAGTSVAAPASYALVGSLRQSGSLEQAALESSAFLRRFPESHYVDDCLYFLADSRFRRFEEEPSSNAAGPAREAATSLANKKFKRQNGSMGASEFRSQAWHLLARIHHVLGELDPAIALYRKARAIEDAREALAYLTQTELSIDPTNELPLGEGAEVTLRYRNVDEAELKTYPVDLQVLFAIRKTLVDLHKVDLSGIVPAHQWTLPLPGSGDHQAHETTVKLPIEGKAPGVWLVIVKSGGHETSTLVIKTDLKVVLQRVGQKIRAYVTDHDGRPVRGAYVTVSNGSAIRARGVTDGRGVFEAPGVGGTPGVVVSKGERTAIGR